MKQQLSIIQCGIGIKRDILDQQNTNSEIKQNIHGQMVLTCCQVQTIGVLNK